VTENKLKLLSREIKSRDELKEELSDMFQWINEKTNNAEILMQSGISTDVISVQDKIYELNKIKTEVFNKEAHFNEISENQHLKYLGKMSLLPNELSSMIGRIRVAMVSLNQIIKDKEKGNK